MKFKKYIILKQFLHKNRIKISIKFEIKKQTKLYLIFYTVIDQKKVEKYYLYRQYFTGTHNKNVKIEKLINFLFVTVLLLLINLYCKTYNCTM